MSVVERETIEAPAKVVPAEVTTRDVLHRAADLLEEFGWCQDYEATAERGRPWAAAIPGANAFCIGGAVRRARIDLGHGGTWEDPYAWARTAIGPGIINPVWNDDLQRTKAEVVARLREAAEAAA